MLPQQTWMKVQNFDNYTHQLYRPVMRHQSELIKIINPQINIY